MNKIIVATIMSVVGILMIISSMNTRHSSNEGLMLIGALLEIVSAFIFLVGIKEYFLSDIHNELMKLTGDIPPTAKFKQCAFCAEFVRTEAKICKHCGHGDFIIRQSDSLLRKDVSLLSSDISPKDTAACHKQTPDQHCDGCRLYNTCHLTARP